MTGRDMFRLTSKQFQVFDSVVAWVFVKVVNYLSRFKIAPEMLFHDIAVFKNIFHPRLFNISRIWVVVRGHNQDISILSYFTAAGPARGFVLAAAVHRIIFSHSFDTVHRILVPRYVSMIGGVIVSKIRERAGAVFRAELARPGWIGENLFSTLSTLRFNHTSIILVCGR